jgi:hypothetical protein
MLGRGRAEFRGVDAAAPDSRREIRVRLRESGREKELRRGSDVCGRFAVEEERGVRRERVVRAVLREKAEYGERVAEDADAALRALAAHGDLGGRRWHSANRGEHPEFDRRLQRTRPLKGVDGFKVKLRRRGGVGFGHGRKGGPSSNALQPCEERNFSKRPRKIGVIRNEVMHRGPEAR